MAAPAEPAAAPRRPDPLLAIDGLTVTFGPVRAVDGVSLDIDAGPFGLGLVGESGSGKTTIGRAVLRLAPVSAGTIRFGGADVAALRGRALRDYRRAVQIVFQDPDNSLDPRMRAAGRDQPGGGLPLPPPVPAGGGPVPGRGTQAEAGRAGPPGRLSPRRGSAGGRRDAASPPPQRWPGPAGMTAAGFVTIGRSAAAG